MTRYDFTPLFQHTIGFDRLARMMDSAFQAADAKTAYPPYNIEAEGENHYRITMAVAGFDETELDVEVREQALTVTGRKAAEDKDSTFLYHGIAGRDFVRTFRLADHLKVTGANLANGLLIIDLEREVPETMKPRTIEIKKSAPKSLAEKAKKLIESATSKAA
ncbi:MAG: Hsp20 family protein [Hyphomicrobiales bacterium]|nr:Hsp20 family protein [Hyphomicrobiales bacterium]